jgi:dihydroorotate dehydrogenase
VNLGKNKVSPADSNEDYVKGVRTLGPYADVVVINVSSPNTPGLRALQGREILAKLLGEVVAEKEKIKSVEGLPKIAVKVACDLTEEELGDVAAAVRQSGVDGVIVSNTTIRRKGLGLLSGELLRLRRLIRADPSENQDQVGGLSGTPLFPYALNALRTLRPLLPPSTPIIGCGGISSGSDAVNMAKAGASLVQVYTLFGYRGVGTARLLKDEISTELKGHSWKSQIGSEWSGNEMGWNEQRLERESEALKKEAQGLGDLLRELNEKEDLSRLVKEAEAAIIKPTAPRDNLMGAEEGSEGTRTVSEQVGNQLEQAIVAAIEAGSRQPEGRAIEPAREEVVPVQAEPAQPDEWTQSVREGQRRLV